MLLPLSWLKDFVELDGISPDALEEKLFECGFEVEEKKYLGAEIENCVVGQIKNIEKHPDSDHLQICILNCADKGEEIQIVTGAQNVFVGAKVPVALDGARLSGGIKIKNGKLRGVASNGMLCSGEELGIGEEFFPNAGVDGILILPDSVPLGTDIKKIVGLDDWVFDISITANRPDAESIYGMAREVAAMFNKKAKKPQVIFNPVENLDLKLTVRVEDAENCPKYLATVIDNIKFAPSPVWLRQRLVKCGINPISNVVDITNYVLLELGQPMHAFDYEKISGQTLVARSAREGEQIETLNDAVSTLSPKNLVICDAEKPLALAGIMGGKESGVSEGTKIVALESAKFMRESVRKTSRALGIASDSSHRFEKGIDTFTTSLALSRALNLFETLGVGRVTTTSGEFIKEENLNQPIVTTPEKINSILGIKVPTNEMVKILESLEFDVFYDTKEITATAPEFRKDVDGAQDLAEEIIRLYGYKHITPRLLTETNITRGGLNKAQSEELRAKRALTALGFDEMITYSFSSVENLDLLKLPLDAPERKFVKILNPLTKDIAVMKTTLVAGTLEIMTSNFKKGTESGRVFEIANVYFPKDEPLTLLPQEIKTLSLGIWGEKENFFTVKGALENFAEVFGLKFTFAPVNKPYLHPHHSASVLLGDKVVGHFGKVAYDISEKLSLTENAYIAELNFGALLENFAPDYAYTPVSKHPDIKRDLAIVVNESITSAQVEEQILAASKKAVSATLFDIYRGEKIDAGFKSMAFSIVFRAGDEALSHEEVDSQIKKILGRLEHFLGAKVRS